MMAKKKRTRWSLAFAFPLFTAAAILFQSLLLIGALILCGVLEQGQNSSFANFHDKVLNRANYLQSEINYHWTGIAPYYTALSEALDELPEGVPYEETAEFLRRMANVMIPMLRATGGTGCFLILDDVQEGRGTYPALYMRDYDPQTNRGGDNDIYLLRGPKEIARERQFPLDRTWRYDMVLTEQNRDFYTRPYEAAALSDDYVELAYWSGPFRLSGTDDPVFTYSVPLFDGTGTVRGVLGVEISVEYLKSMLPSNELSTRESLGYLIAAVDLEAGQMTPLVSKGGYQKRLLQDADSLGFSDANAQYQIFELEQRVDENRVYFCMEPLELYYPNTPYEAGGWALVGLAREDGLLAFVRSLKQIILLSFLGSLVLGIVAMGWTARKLTKPIAAISRQVRDCDFTEHRKLGRTGLAEIDELLNAVEESNQKLMESALRMSQVMDLVNVRVGAFEYRSDEANAVLTNQVFEILGLEQREKDHPYIEGNVFYGRLKEVLAERAPEEQEVYLARREPEVWVRIRMMERENGCLGVITDVTEEILEKHRIEAERDRDPLTKLLNRAAFQKEVARILERGNVGVAAMAMMDLDRLKRINDTYGHGYGDLYIQEMAKNLTAFPGEHVVTARRSGDEFYAFFYGMKEKGEVLELLEGFYRNLREKPLVFPNGAAIEIRVSVGISWYGEDAKTFAELGQHADMAMYRVKNAEKGIVAEYDATLDPRT